MTYPVDDAGNPRIDFVWGHMPMQPNDQREGIDNSPYTTDGDWAVKGPVGSATLSHGVSELEFGTGDGDGVRFQTFNWGIHDIATTGYSNYPAFLPNYDGDGDAALEFALPSFIGMNRSNTQMAIQALGLVYNQIDVYAGSTVANDNKAYIQDPAAGALVSVGETIDVTFHQAPTVPNVVDFDSVSAAESFIELNGLTLGTVTTSTDGATSGNDGWVKSQSPVAGTKVNAGSAVNLVTYDYVVVANPVTAIQYDMMGPMGSPFAMILPGQVVKPAVGDRITITGNELEAFNTTWTVYSVANDDAYNTGSTKVYMSAPGVNGMVGTAWHTGGLWTLIPRANPTSVTFVSSAPNNVTVRNSSLDGGMSFTGPLEVRIPSQQAAYAELMYGLDTPANNGWVDAQLNFTNIHAVMSPSESQVQALANYKTVASSSVEQQMMGGYYIKLVLTDDQQMNYNMGGIDITGTMNIVSIP